MSDYQYPSALPVTTTGGWARPGWFDILADAQKDGAPRGQFGPADRQELLDDYCQLALCDQEAAGLDILTDGEHRRGGWIEGLTGKMPGLRMKPAPRKLGAIGWDQLPVYEVVAPLDGIESIWDFAGEYEFLTARTTRRPKIGMPGPYGITTELDFSPTYRSRRECADALVPAIRAEFDALEDSFFRDSETVRRGGIAEKQQFVDDCWRRADAAAAEWLKRLEQRSYRIDDPAYRAMWQTFNRAASLPLA